MTNTATRLSPVQPALASALRAVRLLAELGDPVPDPVRERLEAWDSATNSEVSALTELLAPLVLLDAEVDAYGRIVTRQGAARPHLVQSRWHSFLVQVGNPLGIVGELAGGPAGPIGIVSRDASAKAYLADRPREGWGPVIEKLWLVSELATPTALSGSPVEYHVVKLSPRDAGRHKATFELVLGEEQVSPSLTRSPTGRAAARHQHRSASYAATIEFEVAASREIAIEVREPDGRSTTAAVTVADDAGRVYPAKAMRLAPDMVFQEHVYRASGEPIRLAEGRYHVRAIRGPEYRAVERDVEIGADTDEIAIALDRWVDPVAHGYYSGDVHIHAAGCSHYNVPTEGVGPETMIRHVRGEGLWIGSVLTWGPCYYHQRQFFSGETISPAATLEHPEIQAAQGVTWSPRAAETDDGSRLRYDVEVSGFPSSHSGHAILLGLRDQVYPGTEWLEDWPSWNLPVHRWAHEQGALTGYAHCGSGMSVDTEELPNYVIPGFSSIGANEIIVDVPHGLGDFLAGAELSPASELNVWYHLLNVGYRTLMTGETDYPCIYDEGPGVGRTYVRLPQEPTGPHALEAWLDGLRTNSSYFGDGRSHLFDVAVDASTDREQHRSAPGTARVTATVAAWLPEEPPAPLTKGGSRYSAPMGWHLEHARIEGTRTVAVEVVVNGVAVASQTVTADGTERAVGFDVELDRSSWIAVRVLPSAHSQPVFVEIGDSPIRASKSSAMWLADSVEALWAEKGRFIRESERADARAAYDVARAIYLARAEECRP